MNEQIQKLYEQSFVTDSYVNVGPNGAELGIRFDPNKFAELIVRECADWVSSARAESGDRIGDSFYWASKMKQHFGVEE